MRKEGFRTTVRALKQAHFQVHSRSLARMREVGVRTTVRARNNVVEFAALHCVRVRLGRRGPRCFMNLLFKFKGELTKEDCQRFVSVFGVAYWALHYSSTGTLHGLVRFSSRVSKAKLCKFLRVAFRLSRDCEICVQSCTSQDSIRVLFTVLSESEDTAWKWASKTEPRLWKEVHIPQPPTPTPGTAPLPAPMAKPAALPVVEPAPVPNAAAPHPPVPSPIPKQEVVSLPCPDPMKRSRNMTVRFSCTTGPVTKHDLERFIACNDLFYWVAKAFSKVTVHMFLGFNTITEFGSVYRALGESFPHIRPSTVEVSAVERNPYREFMAVAQRSLQQNAMIRSASIPPVGTGPDDESLLSRTSSSSSSRPARPPPPEPTPKLLVNTNSRVYHPAGESCACLLAYETAENQINLELRWGDRARFLVDHTCESLCSCHFPPRPDHTPNDFRSYNSHRL